MFAPAVLRLNNKARGIRMAINHQPDKDAEADLLYGVPAIAKFLGVGEQATRHLARLGRITTFRMGRRLCARKSTLNSDFAALESRARDERATPPPVPPSAGAASLLRPRRTKRRAR